VLPTYNTRPHRAELVILGLVLGMGMGFAWRYVRPKMQTLTDALEAEAHKPFAAESTQQEIS
jgi:hypothetical protein